MIGEAPQKWRVLAIYAKITNQQVLSFLARLSDYPGIITRFLVLYFPFFLNGQFRFFLLFFFPFILFFGVAHIKLSYIMIILLYIIVSICQLVMLVDTRQRMHGVSGEGGSYLSPP